MNNIEFLKELKFFNENPKKAKIIDNSMIFCIIVVKAIFFISLLFFVESMNNRPALIGAFIFIIISIVATILFIEQKNKRYKNFEHVRYAGNPADLFGDLNAPEMAEYLADLKQELISYSGIRGFVAFGICSRLNDPDLKDQRLQRDAAKKSIEEIEIIQKRT